MPVRSTETEVSRRLIRAAGGVGVSAPAVRRWCRARRLPAVQAVRRARRHELALRLIHRSAPTPVLFPRAEQGRGAADAGLPPVDGRRWDAVVAPSGYFPRLVRASAELLAPSAEHYTFVSTISVYADL